MEASGQLVTQPAKSAPGHEVQQKVLLIFTQTGAGFFTEK
jgi:hypothetical protein